MHGIGKGCKVNHRACNPRGHMCGECAGWQQAGARADTEGRPLCISHMQGRRSMREGHAQHALTAAQRAADSSTKRAAERSARDAGWCMVWSSVCQPAPFSSSLQTVSKAALWQSSNPAVLP